MCIDSPSSASYELWFFDVTAYDFSQLHERRDLHTEAQVMEAETKLHCRGTRLALGRGERLEEPPAYP